MVLFEGFRKSGMFVISDDSEIYGDLILNGSKSTLDVYSRKAFNTNKIQNACILGELHDRTKVSLIDCITTLHPGGGYRGDEHYYSSSFFPHYVIFGDEHIRPEEEKIAKVSFHVTDDTPLFYDLHAFGMVINTAPYLAKIADEIREKGGDITLGDDPHLFYFTGKCEIFKAVTDLGVVTAEHRPSYGMPGPSGIKFNNKIFVTIAFKEEVAIDTAIQSVNTLLRFLEIIAGRPQSVRSLAFTMTSTSDIPNSLSVYWSMFPPSEADATERKPHPTDLPIQAAQTPEYFANVLTNWLAKNQEWQNARFRFSNGFAQQHNFTIDRLVGAANMFDILPASAVPADLPLSEELENAKDSTRTLFKSLSLSPEKNSILGALGRLGKASLKHKIRSRAQLILDQVPSNFPDLVRVIDEAVNCRNYFVHGSDTKINYSDESNQVVFFTEALEFIFAASDLIECGWDIKTWSQQSSTLSHPFNRFQVNYERRLQDLNRALVAEKSKRR